MSFSFLDFFFPKVSLLGREGDFVTAEELQKLHAHPVSLTKEELMKMGCVHLDRVTAAANYRNFPILQTAIQRWKYTRIPELEKAFLPLLHSLALHIDTDTGTCLCPVPLHWSRQFWRGFNQAEVLAQMLGREMHAPVQSLLHRTRATGHQARRSRNERKQALVDAFKIRSAQATIPRKVILIDDVCTTGSTLEACAASLKIFGVLRVEAVVLALG